MPEGPQRLAYLIVLGGPLKGRRHDLEEVVTEVLIGADESCHLAVDQPSISPIHARLWADLNVVTVYDTSAPTGVYVNDDRVVGEATVRDGDILWLGAPGDPDSVGVQCRFEPWVEVLPGSPLAAGEVPSAGDPSPTPAASPEPAAVPAPSTDADALFVADDADVPAAAPAAPPQVPDPAPAPPQPSAEAPAEPPAPPEAAPPAPSASVAASTGEDDPFFVGESSPAPSPPPAELPPDPGAAGVGDDWAIADEPVSPPDPAAPAPVDAPAAAPPDPAGEAFFIAEDALTVGPDSESAAPPVEEIASPPAPPSPPPPSPPPVLPEPPPAAEVGDAFPEAEVLEAEPVPEAPAAPPQPPAPPGDDGAGRAPFPPRQEAEAGPRSDAAPGGSGGAAEAPSRDQPPPARRPPSPPRAKPAQAPPRARPAAARRPGRRASRGGSPEWLRALGFGALAAVVLAAIGAGVWGWLGAAPKVEQISPSRVRVGQRATLTGSGFSDDPGDLAVVFGSAAATVLSASSTRLEVEVPEAVVEAGAERRVPVVVRKGDRESEPIEIAVFAGPRLHGIAPDVAMPGDEVLLAGAGWGLGATVQFGGLGASVVAMEPTQIRVTVPALPDTSGTPAPVVVTVGGVDSNPAPFFVGRLPLVTGVAPTTASMGDVLTVSGRGFQRVAAQNAVTIAGVPALVVSAFDDEFQVVVPRPAPGEPARALEVRVPGSEEVGRAVIQIAAASDPVQLRFVAEPFPGPPERPHAVVSTGLGPAFVFSAANGRSAAQRALEAQQRLNQAAAALAASPGLVPEARDLATRPVIGLAGQPQPLLEVAAADAAAYNEDWTRLRGRGGPVTPARLARWWEAVSRDLFLMLAQGQRPSFAAALAPEGRVLQDLFDAGARGGGQGVPLSAVTQARASVRNGLRLVGLRVPASVTAEAPPAPAPGAAAAPAAPTPAPRAEPLELVGTWTGQETEGGRRRYLTIMFRRSEGTISYEGGITLTVPFLSYERPGRDRVRFAVQIRGGMRHYQGQWDGTKLSGQITKDQAGRNATGTFEVRKR